MRFICSTVLVCLLAAPAAQVRRPLAPSDIEAITRVVMLEDTRRFDEAALLQLLQSTHPEVRRRAVIAVGRIVDPKGSGLLTPLRTDKDPEVVASVAFAYGQLKDTSAVDWLAGQMDAAGRSAAESARSLGKIRSPEARTALARFLTSARPGRAAAPVVGEALLASGRFTPPGDIAPIVRWVTDRDTEIRWRAAWALFRLRDPAATAQLLKLSEDSSADVRFWAVRGLSPTLVSAAGLDVTKTAERLRTLLADPDRRVRTEALRSLALYDDDQSVQAVLALLESPDAWLAVSAAEGLGRLKNRAAAIVPRLVAASAPGKPLSVRITALASLKALSPDEAVKLAASLATEESLVARSAAGQAAPVRGPRAEPVKRTEAEYREIVERWIVPSYRGEAKPRAVLGTPRGEIELELHAGDAPLGLEYFVRVVESGEIVGTEFGRVVPNFVAQQRAIRNDVVLRDEVNRLGLTRGNLSWASSGLDTGRPGYTLGMTPQPHNEGDFTALGRVVHGMDVVDALQLGDRITSAKMKR